MIDVESEIMAAGDAGTAFKMLVAVGIDPAVIFTAPLHGAIGLAQIRPCSDGLFDFTETGPEAVVIGIRDDDTGALIDTVAFNIERPARWWRRTGAAVFLNWRAVEWAAHYSEPLTLHPTPMAWLRAGAHGACWLDTGRRLSFWLAGVSEVRALSPDFGRALEHRLADEARSAVPRVRVPAQASAA